MIKIRVKPSDKHAFIPEKESLKFFIRARRLPMSENLVEDINKAEDLMIFTNTEKALGLVYQQKVKWYDIGEINKTKDLIVN